MSPAISPPTPRHLTSLRDLSIGELEDLFDLSQRLRSRSTQGGERPLKGRTVGTLFFRGSLRTRLSMEAAVHALGGQAINMTAASDFWDLEHGEGAVMDGAALEHIKDAAAAISSYVDAIAIRPELDSPDWKHARKDSALQSWARHAHVPIINMESALWHPLQALSDLLTLRDTFGDVAGRRMTITWVQSPTPATPAPIHSLVDAGLRLGMHITIAHPKGYELDEQVLADAQADGAAMGGQLSIQNEQPSALRGAEVVYARSWRSLETWGNPTLAASRRGRIARDGGWSLNEDQMALTNDAYLMHAMPVRRNVEVTDAVLDGPRSLVQAQAANRLHTQKALLSRLLRS
jgi:N-acetylornithine carbamoyltransferase